LRKLFEDLSGHSSSFKRRAKTENLSKLWLSWDKALRVFEITHPGTQFIFYPEILDANFINSFIQKKTFLI